MISRMLTYSVLAVLVCLAIATPVYAQAGTEPATKMDLHWLAVAMAIAAAGCGYGQSKTVAAGCEGVSRNPGSLDTIRFFVILGLAFIEFLALLTFVVILLIS